MTISPFAPTVLVGNIPAGDPATTQGNNYIGDTGNGAGIKAALALVVAGGLGGTVHVRRGLYDFGEVGAPALPLAVAGCRVTGEGSGTRLRMSPADRRLFALTNSAAPETREPALKDLLIQFVAANVGAVGTDLIAAQTSARATLENVHVLKETAAALNANESLTSLFHGGTNTRLAGCRVRNADGNPNLSVAAFRLSGFLGALTDCSCIETNIGLVMDTGSESFVVGCSFQASTLVAGFRGVINELGDRNKLTCVRIVGGTTGVTCLAGGTEFIMLGSIILSQSVAAIQVDLGATEALFVGNNFGGGVQTVLEPSALLANNIP